MVFQASALLWSWITTSDIFSSFQKSFSGNNFDVPSNVVTLNGLIFSALDAVTCFITVSLGVSSNGASKIPSGVSCAVDNASFSSKSTERQYVSNAGRNWPLVWSNEATKSSDCGYATSRFLNESTNTPVLNKFVLVLLLTSADKIAFSTLSNCVSFSRSSTLSLILAISLWVKCALSILLTFTPVFLSEYGIIETSYNTKDLASASGDSGVGFGLPCIISISRSFVINNLSLRP